MHPVTTAVLGAGTMGRRLAALLAGAGFPVLLFERTREAAVEAVQDLARVRPAAAYVETDLRRIVPGSLEDLANLDLADWIVEAVVEDAAVKRDLLTRVSARARPDAVLSTNTSGIPVAGLAEALEPDRRRRWLGTHFFNPPRYLHLVEVVPTEWTDPAVTGRIEGLLDRRLGKGVVRAHDRPGFIANRLGIYGALRTLEAVAALGLSFEDGDALTGPVIGRPKSATFRTLDLAGLDVFLHVAADMAARLAEGGADYEPPPLLAALVAAGALGDKAGRGFYSRAVSPGGYDILTLDPGSMTWRPKRPASVPGLEAIQAVPDLGARITRLFQDPGPAGAFTRATLGRTLLYAADVAGEIAPSLDEIDRAMRWGFGWEAGPFEIWDAVGVDVVLEAMGRDASTVAPRSAAREPATPVPAPALVRARRGAGATSLRPGPLGAPSPEVILFREAGRRVVRRNAGGSLVDLGDGVLGLDLHSKMNTVGGDTLAMIHAGLAEASAHFAALVIGSDADLFSAGANLTLLLLEAQDGNWDEVDRMVREFQRATVAIARAPVPVVVAARGLCLGGGCEIALRADRVQAGVELYVGLVETSVGLIPAAGGSAAIVQRAQAREGLDPFDALQRAFEAAALARVSTSAPDARRLGYLRPDDGITMNPDRVLADACAVARVRARTFVPRDADPIVPVGGPDAFARLSLGVHLAQRAGRASDHDALVGRTLAWVMSGGDVPAATALPESRLLDLEREAFLKLCGERKTRDRIAHTLKTGKPLRN